MTVNQLHKLLGELVSKGHGRKPVCINKHTFTHPLEDDGANILPVVSVSGPEWIYNTDDDGGVKQNKDGTESATRTVVLRGLAVEQA
jgi:hypothetical protein